MTKKRWILSAVLLVLLAFSIFMAKAGESWRLKVHYKMTDETVCAIYVFDTEKACTGAKIWFEKESAWHGQNEYECILESKCPEE